MKNLETMTRLAQFVADGGEMEMPMGLVKRLEASPEWAIPHNLEEISQALFEQVVLGPEDNIDFRAAALLLDYGVAPQKGASA